MKKSTATSSISHFIRRFIEEPSKSPIAKTRRESVMGLFSDYLARYGQVQSDVERTLLVVTASIKDLKAGHFRDFLSWFVIQKVIGVGAAGYVPVLREFVEWLIGLKAVTKKASEEMLAALDELQGEPERCERLAKLLYDFANRDMPTYEDWQRDPKAYAKKGAVLRAIHHEKPEEILDGYFMVARIGPGAFWLTPIDPDAEEDDVKAGKSSSDEIGPVQVPVEAAKLARVGDGLSAAIGKMRGFWKLLETGSVHPGEKMKST